MEQRPDLTASDLASGLLLGEGVRIGPGVPIGSGVVLRDGGAGRVRRSTARGRHDRRWSGPDPRTRYRGIGRANAVDNDVIGSRVSIQSNCYITADTVIQDEVFVAPGVITTNTHTVARTLSAWARPAWCSGASAGWGRRRVVSGCRGGRGGVRRRRSRGRVGRARLCRGHERPSARGQRSPGGRIYMSSGGDPDQRFLGGW
jgi:hypothetical protein